ncbi:unnamed protein product [Rotaria socialis]|uniref:Uncharacterized protein n=2 Tax=Rotaria socialis TaxID=392032 RepID=A0A821WLT0_9BILA|nr:unnamed protein product [Rotaria socialis]
MIKYATNETLLFGIFKNQIRTLFITIDNNHDSYEEMELSATRIINYILNVFTGLIYLKLHESLYKNCARLLFDDEFLPTFRSSTLLKLNIRIQCFDDCLYLLDGRFSQLHTLCVDLVHINRPHEIKNQGDLPNLKCFSPSCNLAISFYDELILPLLYRMSNLEQLGLYIETVNTTLIDGNHLKRDVINPEDIQRTFVDFPKKNIISNVDYFPEAKQSQCRIYSYPSFTPYYNNITNNFPGGLFQYVRVISLYDEYPFEHEFFIRIQKSFPFIEELTVINYKSQNEKQSYESINDSQNLSLVEYSFLNEIAIVRVHDHYIEQFLFNTKTYLHNNVLLHINYESLQRVTHNFTRENTQINCAKINELILYGERCPISSLQKYFPNAKICFFKSTL